ncbi:Pentatricopeptide repeat-containing protein [Gracilariopsis chorda]|uniref:Pentatricopeptide repeat-containing protein n=1 Tax=Gracilariopsis chorda TaxID=448386 RepID=A0A2V3IF39_9FLOR|nr:Pentatricopeptide repeat-containing protein [Gracilariopsis chorda]|eukprot:PXF40684.1 Pentatricopeptide repeat-containing protein [Gracilariopsis chorda]
MRIAGVAPTIVTYSVAIDAWAKCSAAVAVDQAFDLMTEMKRSGLEPNLVTYNSLIHTCARAKRSHLAFKVLQFIREDRILPDIVTLCSLADACGRSGDAIRAFEIIEQLVMELLSIKPNLPVYNAPIHACFKANDFESMKIAFDALNREGLQTNVVTYSTLISAYAAKSRVKDVIYYLNKMQESGMCPNKLTFTSVCSGYGRSGNVDQAMEMLEKARKIYGKPDEELYTAAIVAAIGGDRKETVLKLAKEMSLAGYCVPSVLNKMIRKAGDPERSGAELRSMLSAMEALNVRPQRVAIETIVKAYAEEGDVVSAFGVLPDMQRLGYPPNHQTYRSLIHACTLSKEPLT